MKKILITGSSGQLGKALNEYYSTHADVQIFNSDIDELDITDETEVLNKVSDVKPAVIINCAAHTQVDVCESDKEKAYLINAIGPRNLSVGANEVGAILVHISSDYVFDGRKDAPYTEADEFNPLSVYGETKLAGETFVTEIARKYFVVRTAWLYGEGNNFVNTMLKLAKVKNKVTVVSDQQGTPTSAEEVVKVIDLLINSQQYGTYHATCEGECSWAEFAQRIFDMCGLSTGVVTATTAEYGAVAIRPSYSVLDNKRLREEFGYEMAEWHDALKKYLKDKNLLKKEMS